MNMVVDITRTFFCNRSWNTDLACHDTISKLPFITFISIHVQIRWLVESERAKQQRKIEASHNIGLEPVELFENLKIPGTIG